MHGEGAEQVGAWGRWPGPGARELGKGREEGPGSGQGLDQGLGLFQGGEGQALWAMAKSLREAKAKAAMEAQLAPFAPASGYMQ